MKHPLLTLLIAFPTIASAQINIAMHNGATTLAAMNTRPAGSLVDTGSDTWNNPSNNAGVGMSFSDFALLDRLGADTGAKLAANAGFTTYNNNGWGSQDQDWVMMEGWYGFRGGGESLTVTNLPAGYAAEFSVVVYGNIGSSRTMNYTIGATTKTIVDAGSNFAGTFTEGANFVTFTGLSGSSFTLTGNPGGSDPRSAVNGLIIVPGTLPEPPEIMSFTVDDAYVTPGTEVTFSWDTSGATSWEITPSVGTISGDSGSVGFTVTATTEFTLTASNNDGSRSATLRVGAGPPRPNILFFLVDDMGWQDTSEPFLYDGDGAQVVTPLNMRYRTPNMESMADIGMKFTNAYAMPVCTPTRISLITGKNSPNHGVTNWTAVNGGENGQNSTATHNSPTNWLRSGLPQSETTLPSLLQAAGYRTIHAGKAHFGSNSYARDPEKVGFDVNIAGSEIGHPASYSGSNNFGSGSNHVPGLELYHGTDTHLSEALTLEMGKAIEAAVSDGAPFYAYMAHYAVHSPFQTDARFSANYPSLSGSQLAYATLLEGMDKSLGDLFAKLDALGVAEDTLVIFLSDNGGDAPISGNSNSPVVVDNAPLRHKKGSKYEGGVRVPMMVAWAQADAANGFQAALPIPAGSREDDIVACFDVFSTILGVAGVDQSEGLDGHDLRPYLSAQPGSHRPQELLIHFPHDHRGDYFGIYREGDWKLINNFADDSFELYNLAVDLSESDNLASTEPERVLRMSRKMARAYADQGAQWPTLESNSADDAYAPAVIAGVDVDGDGIDDSAEDANSNGLLDPGETDPDSDNTDGDPTPDGAELKTGTDPLNPGDFFTCTPRESGGRLLITWPSKSGASYRIETSSTLTGPWAPLAENVPAHGSDATTTYDAAAIADDPRRFIRVELLD